EGHPGQLGRGREDVLAGGRVAVDLPRPPAGAVRGGQRGVVPVARGPHAVAGREETAGGGQPAEAGPTGASARAGLPAVVDGRLPGRGGLGAVGAVRMAAAAPEGPAPAGAARGGRLPFG